ncbi:MAG: spore coat protein U domain-containing protein [Ramlibacter sp.]
MSFRHFLSAIVAAAAFAWCGNASAATATGTFSVGITLNSNCLVNTTATNVAFTYYSFTGAASSGSAAATSNSSFTLQCTNTLAVSSIALDGTASAGVYSYTDSATNLTYTLQLGATPASDGTAKTVSITGSMAAGQAGICATTTCSNGSSTNKTRTITVTF